MRAEWHALAEAGLSSLARHPGESNRPHVTLLVRERLSAVVVDPGRSFGVTLGAPLLFGSGDRRVLARSVVPTRELLALHCAVHALAGPGEDAAHTAPGAWTPHVTLARRLRVADLPQALAVIGEEELPGRALGLRRWDAASATVTDLGTFV